MNMNILVMNGSPRQHGKTGILARWIAKKYDLSLYDLSTESLPLYNGEKSQANLPAVIRLRESVQKAEGFVWCTPEYHNAMSGALKNALDFLSGSYFEEKPVALLAVAGGGKGGINALNNMRTVSRGLYAYALPTQLVVDADNIAVEQHLLMNTDESKIDEIIQQIRLFVEIRERGKNLGRPAQR